MDEPVEAIRTFDLRHLILQNAVKATKHTSPASDQQQDVF
jgi:hypothetical protein